MSAIWSPPRTPSIDLALEPIVAALRAPPYHVVLRGFGASGTPLETLVRALAASSGIADCPPRALSFTRVRVDADSAARPGAVTRYSRTAQALGAHTDSSNLLEPHHLLAFQMIRPDAAGGETVVIALDRLLARMPAALVAALRTPVPFGRDLLPVLNGGSTPWIRYCRAQIEHAIAGHPGHFETGPFDALDAMLDRPDLQDRFRLEAGDVLLLNNRRALHGRTAFAPDSDRLLHRFRIHAPCLD